MNMLFLLCGNEGIFYLYFVAMKEYFIFTLWQWRNILSLLCGNEGLFFFTLWQWRNILSLLCGNEGIFYLYLVAMKEYFIFTLWRCKNSSFSIASCSRSLSKTYLYAIIKLIHPHFCQYVKYHLLVILNCVILEIFKVWYHERECKGISVRLAGLLALGSKWQKAAWLITFNLTIWNCNRNQISVDFTILQTTDNLTYTTLRLYHVILRSEA